MNIFLSSFYFAKKLTKILYTITMNKSSVQKIMGVINFNSSARKITKNICYVKYNCACGEFLGNNYRNFCTCTMVVAKEQYNCTNRTNNSIFACKNCGNLMHASCIKNDRSICLICIDKLYYKRPDEYYMCFQCGKAIYMDNEVAYRYCENKREECKEGLCMKIHTCLCKICSIKI